MKSVRSFSGQYFSTFGLNTERYSVSLHIQSKYLKIRTRKAPNTDTFQAVSFFAEIAFQWKIREDLIIDHSKAKVIPLLCRPW